MTVAAPHPELVGSVRTVVDHIEHIAGVAGVDRVGLGSDFDGVNMLPEQPGGQGHRPTVGTRDGKDH